MWSALARDTYGSIYLAMRPAMRVLLLFLSVLIAAPAAAQDAWAPARQPGVMILMRHATAPGTGDPSNFRLGDCGTQRNLSGEGRAQARRIGAAIGKAGIDISRVLTSQWCRAEETARLLDVAVVEPEPALNSFFAGRSNAESVTSALLARLKTLQGRKVVLVTHQVNITALTGIYPASGEMIFIELAPSGGVAVRGRLAIP